ncbi:bifunctional hydroxymethylpyrimidine kinase/phosphomethylpyrimidine kinase [Candidatus Uhrbacteria bacterium]|nr:bifunctional hydroxymethylpyrimidine kinase/phosphomethylpyrimidine kinase [Candidatus Uhrbacteria bacterium]
MIQKNELAVLSTFSHDTLIRKDESVINRQEGGPAFYIKKVLEEEKTRYILKTGKKMNVEILVTKREEFGRVPKNSIPKKIKFSQIVTPFLLISSVLDEFNLENLYGFKGKIFFDIQGYVRDGDDFGKKKTWKPSKEVFGNIFCLKGTKEELQNIPKKQREAQKKKILLITKGERGSEIFVFGKRYIVKPSKVIRSKNTVGAGDTFFSYVTAHFIKTKKVLDSIQYATEKTTLFLILKNTSKNHTFS